MDNSNVESIQMLNNHIDNNQSENQQQEQQQQQQQQQQPLEHIASNVKGSVKWFHRIKGFGFLTRDDTKEDIFVHYSGIKLEDSTVNKRTTKRRLNLMDNEKVTFDIVRNNNQLEARNVTGRNGSLIVDLIAFKRGIPPFGLDVVNEQRQSGKVKWFNVKLRYGYIQCDQNGEDIYVHANAIVNNNPNKYKPSLHDGESVEFDLLKRRNGKLEAVNITGPNGSAVEGSEYSPDKTDKTQQPCIESQVTGTVKWFNLKSGFGYITRSDNSNDVYVHYSSIASKNPSHRLRSLGDGETVLFNIIDGKKGPEAVNVTGPNGNPVNGSNYVRPNRPPVRNMNRRDRRDPPRGDRNNNENRMRPRRGLPRNKMSQPPMQSQQMHMGPPPLQNRGRAPPRRLNPRQEMPNRRVRNVNNNYMKNPYDNQNLYGNNEPLYYTFRPKSKPMYPAFDPSQNAPPRRIPYDKFSNMMMTRQPLLPPNRRNGPPPQMFNRNMPRNNFSNNNFNNLPLVETRVPGSVKWYNFKKSFGFITRFDNGEDIFVHQSGIKNSSQFGGMPLSLDDGEHVEFDICQDNERLIAVNVTGPSGNIVKGSKYANQRSPVKTKVYRRSRNINVAN